MGGACITSVEEERYITYRFFEKPEGRRPLGRPRRRWDGNIKFDL
jgi:hypothetical protein